MGVHDWTRVTDNVFHDFHNRWIARLTEALNNGLLPSRYAASVERKNGTPVIDVLAPLPVTRPHVVDIRLPAEEGGISLADRRPPLRSAVLEAGGGYYNSAVVVRDGERPVAVVEVVSPDNRWSPAALTQFVWKVNAAVRAGVHVVLLDILPPLSHMHGGLLAVLYRDVGCAVKPTDDAWQAPVRTVAVLSYLADRPARAFFDFVSVGDQLPELPLFLNTERYINLPLAETYAETFEGTDFVTRGRLEG